MVKKPIPSSPLIPPGSTRRFGASRTVIQRVAGRADSPERADPTA
jgi:hypothetical protein